VDLIAEMNLAVARVVWCMRDLAADVADDGPLSRGPLIHALFGGADTLSITR
jgi:hypothetical protein